MSKTGEYFKELEEQLGHDRLPASAEDPLNYAHASFEQKGRAEMGMRRITCEEADLIGIRNNPYVGRDEKGEINFYYFNGYTFGKYDINEKVLRDHRNTLEYFWQKQNL